MILLPAAADPALSGIRDEGLNRSQVMATLDTLCDVIGQRPTDRRHGRVDGSGERAARSVASG